MLPTTFLLSRRLVLSWKIEKALFDASATEKDYKERIFKVKKKLKSKELLEKLQSVRLKNASSQSLTDLLRIIDDDHLLKSPKTPRLEPGILLCKESPAATFEPDLWKKQLLPVLEKLMDVYGNQRLVSEMSFNNWKLDRLVETGFRLLVLVCMHFMLQTMRGVSAVPGTLSEILTKLKREESYTVCGPWNFLTDVTRILGNSNVSYREQGSFESDNVFTNAFTIYSHS